jgi:hypothetical protein
VANVTHLQKSRPFRVRELYLKHGRPRHELIDELVRQIQTARATEDPAIVMADVMMVRTLVSQIV